MATRYVWNKYELTGSGSGSGGFTEQTTHDVYGSVSTSIVGEMPTSNVKICSDIPTLDEDGRYKDGGYITGKNFLKKSLYDTACSVSCRGTYRTPNFEFYEGYSYDAKNKTYTGSGASKSIPIEDVNGKHSVDVRYYPYAFPTTNESNCVLTIDNEDGDVVEDLGVFKKNGSLHMKYLLTSSVGVSSWHAKMFYDSTRGAFTRNSCKLWAVDISGDVPVFVSQEGSSFKLDHYPYLVVANTFENAQRYYHCTATGLNAVWRLSEDNGITYVDAGYEDISGNFIQVPFDIVSSATSSSGGSAGDLIGRVSSANRGTYPDDAESGGYYYVYLGSDNIDPTAVRCSPTSLNEGGTLTATLTPSSGEVYGGVLYAWQSCIDESDTWTDIGSPSANTSITVTAPNGAESIRVRVRAMDNLG